VDQRNNDPLGSPDDGNAPTKNVVRQSAYSPFHFSARVFCATDQPSPSLHVLLPTLHRSRHILPQEDDLTSHPQKISLPPLIYEYDTVKRITFLAYRREAEQFLWFGSLRGTQRKEDQTWRCTVWLGRLISYPKSPGVDSPVPPIRARILLAGLTVFVLSTSKK
jgi:hypothetical protein